MSRAAAAFGIFLAVGCGVLTAYASLGPELRKQRDERLGVFEQQHAVLDSPAQGTATPLSDAIRHDFRQAGEEIRRTGFAWGIRDAIFGKMKKPVPAHSIEAPQPITSSPAVPDKAKHNTSP